MPEEAFMPAAEVERLADKIGDDAKATLLVFPNQTTRQPPAALILRLKTISCQLVATAGCRQAAAAARRDSFWDPPTKPAMSSADDPQPATVERTETGNDSFWNGTSRNERSASALRRASDTPSIMSSIEEAKPIQIGRAHV